MRKRRQVILPNFLWPVFEKIYKLCSIDLVEVFVVL